MQGRKIKVLVCSIYLSAFVLSTSPEAQANVCNGAFSKYMVIDFKIEEKPGNKLKLSVFREDNLVGKSLNFGFRLFGKTLRLDDLTRAVYRLQQNLNPEQAYFDQLLDAFQIQLAPTGESLAVPQDRPAIYYANHPLSGLDAFALAAAIQKQRKNLKVLVTSFLGSMPGLSDHAFLIRLQPGPEAKAHNKIVLAQVSDHLRKGKSLLIFPAGAVSAYNQDKTRAVDVAWKPGILRFAGVRPDTILKPILVWGQPSEAYLKLRDRSVAISNAYVFREMANQIGTTIRFTVGKDLSWSSLSHLSATEQLDYLRAQVYDLETLGITNQR